MGKSLATLEVSKLRQAATALRPRGSVERRPSRCRKDIGSIFPSAAAKCADARLVISSSVSTSSARRATDSEEWNSLSLPRCTASLSRSTSSSAISASGEGLRPRRKDIERADSNRTFCHSRVRAACSGGIGPK